MKEKFDIAFAIRMRRQDRALLRHVAAKMERCEADTVRVLVRDAARKLGIGPVYDDPKKPTEQMPV